MNNQQWREQAACRGADPSLFDSLDGRELRGGHSEPLEHPRIQSAVGICAGCPVRDACGMWAEAYDAVGVWGGRYRRLPTTPKLSPVKRRRAARKAAA